MRLCAELAFMKKWVKKSRLSLFLSMIGLYAFGQDIPIGTWRTHFSYEQAKIVVVSPTKVFCAVENGFFSYSLADKSTTLIGKAQGLSDVDVSSLIYDEPSGMLIIGYESGLIDLVAANSVKTVTALRNSTLFFDKRINDLAISGNTLYASNGLGVIAISLSTGAIVDNYRSIGPEGADTPTQELAVSASTLYILSDLGISRGNLDQNLLDFNNWELIAGDTASYRELQVIDEDLYLVKDNQEILQYSESTFSLVYQSPLPISQLRSFESVLYMSSSEGIFSIKNGQPEPEWIFDQLTDPADFLIGDDLWLADHAQGLISKSGLSIQPNGPIKDAITHLKYLDNKVYAFYGPKPSDFTGDFDNLGYSAFDGISWQYTTLPDFSNLVDVAQFNNELYFASQGGGLFASSTGLVNGISPGLDGLNTQLTSLTASSNHLYVAAYEHPFAILQMDKSGVWSSFSTALVGTANPTKLSRTQSGILWMIAESDGLIAFDTEGEEQITMGLEQGLPSRQILDFSISPNEEVWTATTSGVVNYPVASLPFEGFEWVAPFFESEQLFEDTRISAIETDGGNRVWIAVGGEISVFNATFSRRDHLFTPENSPLPGSVIQELTYNPQNGEMYILTDKGLVSYRSNSSRGGLAHRNVQVFPNPVLPEFNGEVGIKGVIADAAIKITDITGKLVATVESNGGTASWNLRDFNGQPIQSGVYFILSSSFEGDDTYVGKIAVLR